VILRRMDDVDAILALRTWAVVGCSPNSGRPSHGVARFLIDRGYDAITVNPGADEVLGRRCFSSLRDVPQPIDVVDVFRRSEHAGAPVEEAIARGARARGPHLG